MDFNQRSTSLFLITYYLFEFIKLSWDIQELYIDKELDIYKNSIDLIYIKNKCTHDNKFISKTGSALKNQNTSSIPFTAKYIFNHRHC